MTHARTALFTLNADGSYQPADTETIVGVARECLDAMFVRGEPMTSPALTRSFLSLRLAKLPHEVFAVLFLDARLHVLEYREMFRGTLTQTSVYPREIVKEALTLNAGSVVLAHNHPTGVPDPSQADELLTRTIKSTLALVDVRVIDHVVVGGGATFSFAENGLL